MSTPLSNPAKRRLDAIAAGIAAEHGIPRHEAFRKALAENPALHRNMLVTHNGACGRSREVLRTCLDAV